MVDTENYEYFLSYSSSCIKTAAISFVSLDEKEQVMTGNFRQEWRLEVEK